MSPANDRKARSETVAAEEVALLLNLGLSERSTLIDFGAGTGAPAVTAAVHCRRVVAVDPSAAMLDVLAARAARMDLENVEVVLAGFLTYEHQGDAADFVYPRNALHHLPDFWKALALKRIADILKPGGMPRLRDLVFAFDSHRHTASSRAGSRARRSDQTTAGRARNSKSTCAKSTAPSAGCSNLC
jgi:ubiquinone/menaquinone biosynthesis C-methylase UbiE